MKDSSADLLASCHFSCCFHSNRTSFRLLKEIYVVT